MGTWNYVINEKFTEQYGEGAAARYTAMLGDVASRVRPGDRDGAARMLEEGFAQLGFEVPPKTVDQLAENLTLEEHDRLVVSDDTDRVVGDYPLPGGPGRTTEETRRHLPPDADERPVVS